MPLNFTLLHTEPYGYIAEELLALAAKTDPGLLKAGKVERKTFPDGEHWQSISNVPADIRGRDVILLGGTISELETLQMHRLAHTLMKGGGARSLAILSLYTGYSTQERSKYPGEVVVAQTNADLFSRLPRASEISLLMLDLHSEGIPFYYSGDIRAEHLYCENLIIKALSEHMKVPYVLGSTDGGRAAWVRALAKKLGVSASFVSKYRESGSVTQVVGVEANHLAGMHVVIYDDMIRTGGSLIKAAEAYKSAGATGFSVIATHGVLPGDSLKRLQDSGHFERIIVTNTHPRSAALASQGLTVVSVADILLARIREGFRCGNS